MNLTAVQRRQGNPAITDWCPTCQCRVVALRDGRCGWCSYPVTGEARRQHLETRARREREAERQRAARRRVQALGFTNQPSTTTLKVADALKHRGPSTVPDLAQALDLRPETVRSIMKTLRERGAVQAVSRQPGRGMPRTVWQRTGEKT